jgi:hypothetical protein
MSAIDPRNIYVMSSERAAELRRMTPKESLDESFRLTEQKRSEIALEIAAIHPQWSPREVELERNRRWLLMSLEGEVFGATSEVLYDLLCFNQRREGANLDRVARLLGELPQSFRTAFQNVVEHSGYNTSGVKQVFCVA